MKINSQTDWERLKTMGDEEIDFSDIPPLGPDFFTNAQLRLPEAKHTITIRLDSDVIRWYKSKGKGYQTRMNAVLRMYMEASKERAGNK